MIINPKAMSMRYSAVLFDKCSSLYFSIGWYNAYMHPQRRTDNDKRSQSEYENQVFADHYRLQNFRLVDASWFWLRSSPRMAFLESERGDKTIGRRADFWTLRHVGSPFKAQAWQASEGDSLDGRNRR